MRPTMAASDSPGEGAVTDDRSLIGPDDANVGTPTRKPPLVAIVAVLVLGFTLVAVFIDSRRVRTGDLLVQADASDVRITIKRGERTVVPPTEQRSFTLPPGEYEVALAGDATGFQTVPAHITVEKYRRAVVRIERMPRAAGVRPPRPDRESSPERTGSHPRR
jgi:hypothetical protein